MSGHPMNIKQTFQDMKQGGGHHPAHQYMQNKQNEMRLLFWETTAGCNLECIHCRRIDVSKMLMKNDLTTEESKKLVDQIVEVGNPILVLSGGEPLYRPDILEIASYAKSKGLTVALATNGTLIDEKKAREIVESGIQRVSISIDGADKKTHDEFRKQEGSLERALNGFRHLRKLGMSMQINCTVTQHNVHQLEQLYNLALELDTEALHLFMLVPVGCGVQIAQSNMLTADKYEEVLNWIYDKSREGKIHLKATCAPHYFRVIRQRAKEEGITVTPKTHGMAAMTKGCLAGSAICFISHKGEVFPCGYLPVECGNIRKQSLKDIWEKSEQFQMLRDPNQLTGKCGLCEFKNVCMGCRARAFYNTGNFMDEEPYCTYEPLRMKKNNLNDIFAEI